VVPWLRFGVLVKAARRVETGADWLWEKILADSEDSSRLKTAFIERLGREDGNSLNFQLVTPVAPCLKIASRNHE